MKKLLYILIGCVILPSIAGCAEKLSFHPEDVMNENDLSLGSGQMSFIHISDVHRSSASITPALYYLNHTPSSFALLTGDIMASDNMLKEIRESDKPMLLIPGNHDAYPFYAYSVGQARFRTQVLSAVKQGEKVIFANDQDNYWYQDYQKDGHTLRVIGIDQYEFESVNEGPNSLICVYSQPQIDWLIQLLENSGHCDGIIMAIHAGFGNGKVMNRDREVTNDFISIYAKGYETAYDYTGEKNIRMIPDIINAYQTGVNLTEQKYGNSSKGDSIVVSTHFKGSHQNFIAYMGGHLHFDIVEHLTDYPQQLLALIAYCGDGTGHEYNDLIKSTNNKNFYNFNVNIIDFKKRELKIIRKGANVKVDGTTRDSIVFRY